MVEPIEATSDDRVIPERFDEAREACGVSIQWLALHSGISRFTLWRKLRGRSSWRPLEIERLASLLKVSVRWLVGRDV